MKTLPILSIILSNFVRKHLMGKCNTVRVVELFIRSLNFLPDPQEYKPRWQRLHRGLSGGYKKLERHNACRTCAWQSSCWMCIPWSLRRCRNSKWSPSGEWWSASSSSCDKQNNCSSRQRGAWVPWAWSSLRSNDKPPCTTWALSPTSLSFQVHADVWNWELMWWEQHQKTKQQKSQWKNPRLTTKLDPFPQHNNSNLHLQFTFSVQNKNKTSVNHISYTVQHADKL